MSNKNRTKKEYKVSEFRRLSPFLIVIIALLLASLFLHLFENHQRQSFSNTLPVSPTQTAVQSGVTPYATPIVTYDSAGIWKTYTNPTIGYSVQVPQDWVIEDHLSSIPQVFFTTQSQKDFPFGFTAIFITGGSEKMRYAILDSPEQYKEWLAKPVSNGSGMHEYKIGTVKVDGLDAIKLVRRSLPGDPTEGYYSVITWFRKNNKNYYIEVGGADQNLVKSVEFTDAYNKMLSSFKFTK